MIPYFNKIVRYAIIHTLLVTLIGVVLFLFGMNFMLVGSIVILVSLLSYSLFLMKLFQECKKKWLWKISMVYLVSVFLFSISYLIVTAFMFKYFSLSDKYVLLGMAPMTLIMSFIIPLFYEKKK